MARLLSGIAILAGLASAPAVAESWVASVGPPRYFAVSVADVDAAVAWYGRAFGLELLDDNVADDGSWRIANLTGEQLLVEIIRDDRDGAVDRARGFVKVGFGVPDVSAVADRVAAATGERPSIVDFARHGVRILQLRDPEGNLIQLTSPLEAEP